MENGELATDNNETSDKFHLTCFNACFFIAIFYRVVIVATLFLCSLIVGCR